MSNNDDFFPFLILFVAVAGLFFMLGFTGAESTTRRETISYCIEKPTACRTKYDFYKLENQK